MKKVKQLTLGRMTRIDEAHRRNAKERGEKLAVEAGANRFVWNMR